MLTDIQFFVQNVKRILDERKISYSRAGRESGAGIDFIRDMERKGSWPSTEKIMKMADYLGVSVSELLGEGKEPAPLARDRPVHPPEYDQLSPEDKALVDSMIRRLILEKNQEGTSSPSNGAGGETA